MTTNDVQHDPMTDCELTDGKANFDAIYNGEDPRSYFGELGSLDYEIPQQGQEVFAALLDARTGGSPQDATVFDLCCSYGVNAALMTCDLDLGDLTKRYVGDDLRGLTPEGVRESDAEFYSKHRQPEAPTVAGLDISERAVDYAQHVGLLEPGIACNLEEDDPTDQVAEVMREADLVTVTGGIGYIGVRTFAKLFDLVDSGRKPWLASFVLRRYSFSDIADALSRRGYVSERLPGRTFPQRRFANADEREFTLRHLEEAGLDVTNREAEGWYHTDMYLTRPAEEAYEHPIAELLGDLDTGTQGVAW
jgi:hypothetical protein